jgi:hypothetical protein
MSDGGSLVVTPEQLQRLERVFGPMKLPRRPSDAPEDNGGVGNAPPGVGEQNPGNIDPSPEDPDGKRRVRLTPVQAAEILDALRWRFTSDRPTTGASEPTGAGISPPKPEGSPMRTATFASGPGLASLVASRAGGVVQLLGYPRLRDDGTLHAGLLALTPLGAAWERATKRG